MVRVMMRCPACRDSIYADLPDGPSRVLQEKVHGMVTKCKCGAEVLSTIVSFRGAVAVRTEIADILPFTTVEDEARSRATAMKE